MFLIIKTALGFGALTTGIDNFTGGANNDTFIGQTSTIQAGDRINGGGGVNQFDIYLDNATEDANNMSPMTVSNVQNFYIQNTGDASTANFVNVSGAQQIWNNASTAALTVSNVNSLAAVGVEGAITGTYTVNFAASVTEGTADTVSVVASGATTETVAVGAGFETVDLIATGKNTIATLTTGAKTINITGSGDLKVTNAIVDATTLNGSAATGKLDLTSAVAKVVVTTGSAADTVTLSYAKDTAGITKETAVNLGDGNDTLKITALQVASKIAAGATFNAGEGTLDVLNYAYGDLVNTTTGKYFSNFEVVDLVGAGGTYALAALEANNTIGELRVSGALRANTTVNDLAKDAPLNITASTGNFSLAVNVKGAGAAGAVNDSLDINVGGKAAVTTQAITVANVETINIDSSTTATTSPSSVANTVGLLSATSATSINLTGANQLTITSFGADAALSGAVKLLDASEMTGKLIMGDAAAAVGGSNAILTLGGSAADTLRLNATAGSVVQGNGGADTIYLGTTPTNAQILKYVAQSDSTGAAWDMVTNFTVSTTAGDPAVTTIQDKIDISFLGFTGAEAAVAATSKATLTDADLDSTFSISTANAATFFTNNGVQTGVVYQKSGTDHTFVFIDANKDGAWEATSDMAILLDGDTGNLVAGNFVFA